MNTSAAYTPRWATAADGEQADTSPVELSVLSEHRDHCIGSCGRLFALRTAAESMRGFASARFITTLVVVVTLVSAASLLT